MGVGTLCHVFHIVFCFNRLPFCSVYFSCFLLLFLVQFYLFVCYLVFCMSEFPLI